MFTFSGDIENHSWLMARPESIVFDISGKIRTKIRHRNVRCFLVWLLQFMSEPVPSVHIPRWLCGYLCHNLVVVLVALRAVLKKMFIWHHRTGSAVNLEVLVIGPR